MLPAYSGVTTSKYENSHGWIIRLLPSISKMPLCCVVLNSPRPSTTMIVLGVERAWEPGGKERIKVKRWWIPPSTAACSTQLPQYHWQEAWYWSSLQVLLSRVVPASSYWRTPRATSSTQPPAATPTMWSCSRHQLIISSSSVYELSSQWSPELLLPVTPRVLWHDHTRTCYVSTPAQRAWNPLIQLQS